jgi:hypothetical protein
MITINDIVSASTPRLHEMKSQLLVARMRMDKFFSLFLDNAELTEDDASSEWKVYKEMLKDYDQVNHLIKTTDYYINKNA